MKKKISIHSLEEFLNSIAAKGPKFEVDTQQSNSIQSAGDCVCCVAADTIKLSKRFEDDSDKTGMAGTKR